MEKIHFDAFYGQESVADGSSSTDEHPSTRRRRERMIANGWCPHHVEHLSKIYSSERFSGLSRLKRSPVRVADHKRCEKESACIAYNVDNKNYRTRHTTESCNCRMVPTPYKRLLMTIRLGNIPLLSIETVNGRNELRVHRRYSHSRYVAISHVWFDELGNPSQCALPNCWIDELKVRLDVLESAMSGASRQKRRKGPLLFWMDTLCIPVDEKDLALRLKQVDMMASIYKGATSSLVLDAELMEMQLYSISSSVSPNTELVESPSATLAHIKMTHAAYQIPKRIACSVWMCRCWTYQEWQLAPTIAIQLKDSAIVMGHIDDEYQELVTKCCLPAAGTNLTASGLIHSRRGRSSRAIESSSEGRRTINPDKWNRISPDLDFTFFPSKQLDLVTAWNELCGRSTTKSEDVPFILTNVLDYDSLPLLQCDSLGEMLQLFFLSQDEIPLSLFFNMGPRLHDDKCPRNRWIPTEIRTRLDEKQK